MQLTIPVLVGSSRTGRRSIEVARHLHQMLVDLPGLHSPFLDLAEYRFPMLDLRFNQMTDPPPALASFSRTLAECDGLLVVSPEYKAGIPAVLKNAFDLVDPGILKRRPVAVCTVSAGGFGGLQCLAQLRLVILALGGLPIPESLPVSRVGGFLNDEGQPADPKWPAKADAFLQALLWYSRCLKEGRNI